MAIPDKGVLRRFPNNQQLPDRYCVDLLRWTLKQPAWDAALCRDRFGECPQRGELSPHMIESRHLSSQSSLLQLSSSRLCFLLANNSKKIFSVSFKILSSHYPSHQHFQIPFWSTPLQEQLPFCLRSCQDLCPTFLEVKRVLNLSTE